MNIADVQRLTQALVEQHEGSKLPVTVSHTSSSKGLTYTLKAKRTKPAYEEVSRKPAGYHTFTIHVSFDEELNVDMTRRVVDEETGQVNLVEAQTTPESLSDLVTMFEEWHGAVNDVEARTARSLRDQPKMKVKTTPKTTPTSSKPQTAQTPPAVEASSPAEPATKKKKSRSSVHISDPNASSLDQRYYLKIGEWSVRKVLGECTEKELNDLWSSDDPRLAWSPESRAKTLPGLEPTRTTKKNTAFVLSTIQMRRSDGGMLRVNACRDPRNT